MHFDCAEERLARRQTQQASGLRYKVISKNGVEFYFL
jgi:hypothetical protein